MKCSSCRAGMTDWTLDGRLGTQILIDVCTGCQAFWFDQHKSLQLSPGSTLKLLKYIGEHTAAGKPTLASMLLCPRCEARLVLTQDQARNVKFRYWRCDKEHGHFIAFLEFLKEKNFIHTLSPQEIQELRQKVQTVNCANCGASIDLQTNMACPYCHSAITMLDLKQQQEMLAQLKAAAEPKPIDPTLPFRLSLAKMEASALFPKDDAEWWVDAGSSDLVQAGLNTVSRWLSKLVD